MRTTHRVFIIISLVTPIFVFPTKADYRNDSKAIAVSGGEDHTLVLTGDKGAWACGPNGDILYGTYSGVLGTGSNVSTLIEKTLVRVHDGDMETPSEYLEGIYAIGAGWKHSLALDVNAFVWSWGDNFEGQLGIDSRDSKTLPVQVLRGEQTPEDPNNPDPNLARIIAISAGRSGEHSLAVDVNGYAYAWGMNQEGQLGNGQHGQGERELSPVKVKGVNGQGYLQNIIVVSGGADHSMAMEDLDPFDPNRSGRVYTWGSNKWPGDGERYQPGRGKLGDGSIVDLSDTPVRVLAGDQDPNQPTAFLKNIVAISAGWNHCMALEKYEPLNSDYNGRVYTWGSNGEGYGNYQDPCSIGGRLGNGTYLDSNTPVLVLAGKQNPNDPNSYLEHVVAISAGEAHSMALDANGYVYCWGDNYHGQLGNGTNDPCTTPVKVVGDDGVGYLENIVAISAGYWHSLAIDANGTIWTWGKGSAGRLGLGNKTIDCYTPHPIPVVYNVTQETFAFAIQTAIDDANDAGDILEASPGTYYENVNFRDKSVTLRSAEPGDWGVVADTVINANYNQGAERYNFAVNFNNGSGSSVAGFTLAEAIRGGIICEDLSSAYVTNCVIRDNSYDGIYLDSSSLDITSCVIQNNGQSSALNFYGIYCENSAYPDIINITRCIIEDNNDGGIYCDDAATTTINITNNWICDNGTGGTGSGIYLNSVSMESLQTALIRHNTLVDNAGYGISTPGIPDINNCIIWGNASGSLPYSYYNVTYSCVEGPSVYYGAGNINSDPCFVDDANDDYHLTRASLCVDSGDPDFAWDGNETDIDGNPRVMGGRVDMGADEDFPHCDPAAYADWVLFGRPDCWCYPRQCHGDADGEKQGSAALGYTYVSTNDLTMLANAWQIKEPPKGPGIATIPNGICADFDHAKQGSAALGYMRVSTDDLTKLANSWQIKEPPKGPGIPPDCLECDGGGESARGSGTSEQVTSKELLDWLAEIWLDPDVREIMDAEAWLKLYESIKDLE